MKSTTRLGASSHWQLACLFNSLLTITWKDKRIVFVSIADARSTLCANNLAHYCLKHVLVCLQLTLLLSSLCRLDNNGHLNIFRSIVPSVCVRWSPLSWLSMWGKVFSAKPFVSKIVDVFLLRRVSVIKSDIRTINLWLGHEIKACVVLFLEDATVTGEFPPQRPATRSFDVLFDLCLNKRLSKQWDADDLRRHDAHYNVIVMVLLENPFSAKIILSLQNRYV